MIFAFIGSSCFALHDGTCTNLDETGQARCSDVLSEKAALGELGICNLLIHG